MIVFPHIPKTGGTTILNHLRSNLGHDKVVTIGSNATVERLLAGLPQIEEMSAEDFAKTKVLQGHGIDETVLTLLPKTEVPDLFVVLRNPVSHTKSRFLHRVHSHRNRSGRELTPEQFLERFLEDQFQCNYLVKKFPSFVSLEAETLQEQAISVLQKFRYVLVTEKLDEQFAKISKSLRVPKKMERKRSAKVKADSPLSSEQVMERMFMDAHITDAIRDHDGKDAPDSFNPFGFDRKGLENSVKRARIYANSRKPVSQTELYDRLAAVVVREGRAEQILARVNSGKSLALGDEKKFIRILRPLWKSRKKKMNEHQLEKSAKRAKAELRADPQTSRRDLRQIIRRLTRL